jgi:hypothetical protein
MRRPATDGSWFEDGVDERLEQDLVTRLLLLLRGCAEHAVGIGQSLHHAHLVTGHRQRRGDESRDNLHLELVQPFFDQGAISRAERLTSIPTKQAIHRLDHFLVHLL